MLSARTRSGRMSQVEVTTKSASVAFVYFFVLGLAQCICAALWSNTYGALVGATALVLGIIYGCFIAAKICEKRKGYYLVEQGIAIRYYKEFNFAFVMTRTVQAIRRIKYFQIFLGVYLAFLLVVRMLSPDEYFAEFPDSCRDKLQGCARVAELNPHRDSNLSPVQIHSNMVLVQQVVKKWIEDQPRESIIASVSNQEDNDVFLQARFVSLFWGFADDFFVSLGCGEDGAVIVSAQSQLRLGAGDMGVNKQRVYNFITWMQSFQQNGTLVKGSCSQSQ